MRGLMKGGMTANNKHYSVSSASQIPTTFIAAGTYVLPILVTLVPDSGGAPITFNAGPATFIVGGPNNLACMINVDFGIGATNTTTKTGFAATGVETNDFWNYISAANKFAPYTIENRTIG